MRARAKYKLDGEKASRLFCSLEKYNGTQKYIPQLIVEENGLKKNLNNQPEIESASMKFYSKLFSNHDQIITESSIDNTSSSGTDNFRLTFDRITQFEGADDTGELV